LDIILQTAKSVIEALIEIEAYDEVLEFFTKIKTPFPEFAHLFNKIEKDLQNCQWIGVVVVRLTLKILNRTRWFLLTI
jgi:hypothetical protein